jgi:hypothetical protein
MAGNGSPAPVRSGWSGLLGLTITTPVSGATTTGAPQVRPASVERTTSNRTNTTSV